MPVSLTLTSSESNEVATKTLLRNHINKKDNLINNISIIENNTAVMENKNHSISSSWSLNYFVNNIKYYFLKQSSSQITADIELDDILSQGKMLSNNADALHDSLNNKTNIIPTSSLSLTTKTGIALGGLLLTGAIVGGSVYYVKRTGREPHPDMPRNTSNSSLPSTSQISFDTYQSLTAILPTESTTVRDDLFRTSEFKKKSKRHNSFPCPYIHKNKKNQPSLPYIYTRNQPTVCLTESFNQRCQKGHRQSKTGKDCHYIPGYMILKIQGQACYCPPPNFIAMKIIEPKYKKKPTRIKHQRLNQGLKLHPLFMLPVKMKW